MHEWHTDRGTNILDLINQFIGFRYQTDYSDDISEVSRVRITNRVLPNREDAITYVTNNSYGGDVAYLAAFTTKTKKLSKGYQNAFEDFNTKYNEYLKFKNNLTIAYGRKSSKATCPSCGSSISLKFGYGFKSCPVCGSKKIISDSNWKMLETKYRMVEKSSEKLSKEAQKNDITFVCGIEWHC